MTDNEFIRGVVFFIIVIGFFFSFMFLLSYLNQDNFENKFVVVDKYKECDVVRYTDPSGRWNYFLDCSSK